NVTPIFSARFFEERTENENGTTATRYKINAEYKLILLIFNIKSLSIVCLLAFMCLFFCINYLFSLMFLYNLIDFFTKSIIVLICMAGNIKFTVVSANPYTSMVNIRTNC